MIWGRGPNSVFACDYPVVPAVHFNLVQVPSTHRSWTETCPQSLGGGVGVGGEMVGKCSFQTSSPCDIRESLDGWEPTCSTQQTTNTLAFYGDLLCLYCLDRKQATSPLCLKILSRIHSSPSGLWRATGYRAPTYFILFLSFLFFPLPN